MDKKIPFISIVIPAFNEEKYIGNALETIKAQEYPKDGFEIVVVDNNSKDKTREVALSFGVRVVECQKQGVAAARQAGVEAAKGEIIAFTDSDAFLPKNWLAQISAAMSSGKLVAYGGPMGSKGAGIIGVIALTIFDYFAKFNQLFGRHMLWGNNFAVRRDAVEAIGGFDVSLSNGEDWEICLRLAKKFGKYGRIRYDLKHRVSTSSRKQKDLKTVLRYFWGGVYSYYNIIVRGKPISAPMFNVR